jgi:peptidoglycan/LPS O-acetylase OafA/YrhL
MSIGFVLYVALVIALAAVLAWAVESLCRQLGRPARWAWSGAPMIAVALVVLAALETPDGLRATT